MNLKHHKGIVISLAIAILLYLSSVIYYNQYDWSPLELPITKLDQEVTASFTAQLNTNYQVHLEFDRKNQPDYWECIYGATLIPGRCEDSLPSAVVRWTVTFEEKEVAAGVSEGQGRGALWGKDDVSIRITSIAAKEGITYVVAASLAGPEGILEKTKPRIKVRLPASMHKDTFVYAQLMSLLALVFVGIAVLTLVAHLYRKWRSGKQLNLDQ